MSVELEIKNHAIKQIEVISKQLKLDNFIT